MPVQAGGVHRSLDQGLDQGDASAWGLTLICAQRIAGAVGETIAAFHAAVCLRKYLFRAHAAVCWQKAVVGDCAIWILGFGFVLQ